jgi:cytochrome c oxidase cbb3-type subunit 3
MSEPTVPESTRPEQTAPEDGIGDAEQPIPPWWWWTWIATIVFAIVYVPYYHVFTDWSSSGQLEAESRAMAARVAKTAPPAQDKNPYHGDAAAISQGKETFTTVCAACHKPDGTGLVGPSLVDSYWKYGDTDADLFKSLSKGRPAGMPAWESQLGTEKIWKVLAYLETLPKQAGKGMGAP